MDLAADATSASACTAALLTGIVLTASPSSDATLTAVPWTDFAANPSTLSALTVVVADVTVMAANCVVRCRLWVLGNQYSHYGANWTLRGRNYLNPPQVPSRERDAGWNDGFWWPIYGDG